MRATLDDRSKDEKSQQLLHDHALMTFLFFVVISTNFATDFESEMTFPQCTHFLRDILVFHLVMQMKPNRVINSMKRYHLIVISRSHKTVYYSLFAGKTFLSMRLNPRGLTPPVTGMDDRHGAIKVISRTIYLIVCVLVLCFPLLAPLVSFLLF